MNPNEREMDREIEKESEEVKLRYSSENDTAGDADLARIGDAYQVLEQIGKGGMGLVYKARERATGRIFAVKVMHGDLCENKVAQKRFEQEVEAASKLDHPNLVSVYAHGKTETGEPYLVMDYVEGKSLADLIEDEGRLSSGRTVEIVEQVAEAMREAHSRGIIHKDLKPSNILLASHLGKDLVKVADFGIASMKDESVDYTQTLTETADVVGSPKYMSPEQCTGRQLDNRADIYSLGCVIYECQTGKPPFLGGNAIQIILKHMNEKAPDLPDSNPFKNLVRNCLQKEKRLRYSTVDSLIEDLRIIQSGGRVKTIEEGIRKFTFLTSTMSALLLMGTVFIFVSFMNTRAPEPTLPAATKAGAPSPSPIAISEWTTDENSVASHMQGMAFKHFRDRKYAQAIPALKYVAETNKQTGKKFSETFAYQCIGQCYLSLKEYKEAKVWYEKAIEGMKQLSADDRYRMETETLSGYIEVLKQLGQKQEADLLLKQLTVRNLEWLRDFYRRTRLEDDAARVSKQIEEKINNQN